MGDIATWSLEISDPSLYYLLPLDGRIDHSTQPKYQSVDCKAVMSAVTTGTRTATTSATASPTTITATMSPTMAVTTTAAAATTATAASTTAMSTTRGGSCTGTPCDSAWHTSAHCRSRWGFCGTSASHCNAESSWCGADSEGCSCGGNHGRRLRGGEQREPAFV